LLKSIKNELILLGTKGGPAVRPKGSMPSSSLLMLDDEKILIDAGLGVSKSLTDVGFNLNKLSKITSRCLIIVGSDDTLSSKEMNIELNKNIRGSELFFIKQSGHFVMIEQSQKFNKLFFKWLEY